MTQLDANAFITGIIWCVLGLAIYWFCTKKYGTSETLTPALSETGAQDLPQDASEQRAMDREYLVWRLIVGAACILALLLYALPYLTN